MDAGRKPRWGGDSGLLANATRPHRHSRLAAGPLTRLEPEMLLMHGRGSRYQPVRQGRPVKRTLFQRYIKSATVLAVFVQHQLNSSLEYSSIAFKAFIFSPPNPPFLYFPHHGSFLHDDVNAGFFDYRDVYGNCCRRGTFCCVHKT